MISDDISSFYSNILSLSDHPSLLIFFWEPQPQLFKASNTDWRLRFTSWVNPGMIEGHVMGARIGTIANKYRETYQRLLG
jgi:hypothetical protein